MHKSENIFTEEEELYHGE